MQRKKIPKTRKRKTKQNKVRKLDSIICGAPIWNKHHDSQLDPEHVQTVEKSDTTESYASHKWKTDRKNETHLSRIRIGKQTHLITRTVN